MIEMKALQTIFDSIPLLRSLILRLRNRLKIEKNKCRLSNLHCSGNRIVLSGSQNALDCTATCFLRECTVRMDGSRNNFVVCGQSELYGEGIQNVFICGNDNHILVGENCNLRKVSFFIRGNGNRIIIGDNCSAYAVQFHIEQDRNEINIGSGTTMHGREEHAIHMAADEGSKILIGEDCMLSHGIQIRSTDSHSIVDLDGVRINPAKNVVVGVHCWIGLQSILLKGTVLEPHCVVGAGAVCSKRYGKANSIIAGNPAKIVRENIDWDRKFV